MTISRQVPAARASLNGKQEMFAENALVALTALKRLQSERGLPVQESTIRRSSRVGSYDIVSFQRASGQSRHDLALQHKEEDEDREREH